MSEAMESSVTPGERPVAETLPEQPVAEAPVSEEPAPLPPLPEMPAEPQKVKKIKKIKRSRPWPLKILLELIAIVLCLTLFVVTIAGALIVDLRVMTSKGGFEKILNQLITSTVSQPEAAAPAPTPNGSVLLLSDTSASVVSDPITDMVYELLQSGLGDDLPLEKEDVRDFINNSTVKDFLADKVSGTFDDFFNGTSNTTITKDEIIGLVRDNAPLIKESFGVEITDDQLEELETALDEVPILEELEQEGLMGFLEENYLNQAQPDGDAGTMGGLADSMAAVKQVMDYVRMATSNTAIASIAGVIVVLMLLVLLVNWTVPKTLSDIGITLLFAGLVLSSINFVFSSDVLQVLLADQTALIGLVNGILASIAAVHYSILGSGIALIVLAIVAKVIKTRRSKALQAIM